MSVIANILMDSIDNEISISTSILFLLRIGIGIGIDDTFEPSIGIKYRQYFWKVSLTTLPSPPLKPTTMLSCTHWTYPTPSTVSDTVLCSTNICSWKCQTTAIISDVCLEAEPQKPRLELAKELPRPHLNVLMPRLGQLWPLSYVTLSLFITFNHLSFVCMCLRPLRQNFIYI